MNMSSLLTVQNVGSLSLQSDLLLKSAAHGESNSGLFGDNAQNEQPPSYSQLSHHCAAAAMDCAL
jgi:hypothetical protein